VNTEYLDAPAPPLPAADTAPRGATTTTRALLTCGLVAGPLYVVVVVIQMFIRDGFDIRRHAASLLTNGDLGWIQVANFLVTGLLTIAGAVGMRRALRGGRGGTWGPLLLGIYGGVALVGAGIFHADPALGFPPGTPADANAISWHGLLHFLCGGVGFLGFIAACMVFARRFATRGERGWAAYSVATGVLFFAAFAGIASGSKGPTTLAFAIAVALGWAWVTAMAGRLMAALR
jgi:hypothetical protein